MNLGVPEKIEDFKNLPFQGIGLMRTEFILASTIGEHPLSFVESGRSQEFIDKMAEAIEAIKETFELENKDATPEELRKLLGEKRERLGIFEGNLEEGILEAGKGVGLITVIQSVAEVFEKLI